MQVIQFRKLTAEDSKEIKQILKGYGLNFRVQLKNGRVYIYNPDSSMTPQQKEKVRDCLVLLDYVDQLGVRFSHPEYKEDWAIYNGMPILGLA